MHTCHTTKKKKSDMVVQMLYNCRKGPGCLEKLARKHLPSMPPNLS